MAGCAVTGSLVVTGLITCFLLIPAGPFGSPSAGAGSHTHLHTHRRETGGSSR